MSNVKTIYDFTDEVKRRKEHKAFQQLFMEMLLKAFNDILTDEWYRYYMTEYLTNKSTPAKRKLKAHYDAINWFLYERNHLCFRVLGIDHLSDETVLKAISKKFKGSKKFRKMKKELDL